MVNNTTVIPKTVYYHFETSNKTFLDVHRYLKDTGISHNMFFLVLVDPDLAGVNPHDPRLNTFMKQKVFRECLCNYWYFLREVIRVPESGGKIGGTQYRLHRGNLALNFCILLNLNIFVEFPRQHGKTMALCVRVLYEFLFGTVSSNTILLNKKFDDAKDNLKMIKDIRKLLPTYLQMNNDIGVSGHKIKVKDTVESLEHPTNRNRIKTLPSAKNKMSANSIGRGMTVPRIWYDEYAFIPYNHTIFLAAAPAFRTAAGNARKNGSPYGMIISTTPGDMTTDIGIAAYKMKEDATKFNEQWYDRSEEDIREMISMNEKSPFVHIRYTYQQLGSDEQWFRDTCIEMLRDWPAIRREVLLEWSTSSDNSPFTKEDLDTVKALIKQPIATIYLCKYYPMEVYEPIDLYKDPPIIGVDVSGGYRRDSSAITVIDSRTTRVVACMNCNYISPIALAAVIRELVLGYMPTAVVNIERNGGFGASVIAKLIVSEIKRNLFYEIKDKVIEERPDGMNTIRKTQRTKVYGLDSTKSVRELLMDILRQRMTYHKDKFISPIIYHELETLEVKKNGRIEHTDNGHDDQIFSYLMALYVWYEGRNVREQWGIVKGVLRTDEDIDETMYNLSATSENIIRELEVVDEDDSAQIDAQLRFLKSDKTISYREWVEKEYHKEQEELSKMMQNPLFRKAWEAKNLTDASNIASTVKAIPDDVFYDFYKSMEADEDPMFKI